jgi:glutamate N-acetyltransferase/amino-acid N-acetyltransferase
VKTALCGNDPNVGRIVMAIGKHLGAHHPGVDVRGMKLRLGGQTIFENGAFRLDPTKEAALVEHLRQAELYASAAPEAGVFHPAVKYPPHERAVELEIDLGAGPAETHCLGADLTHEYVSENADYRS